MIRYFMRFPAVLASVVALGFSLFATSPASGQHDPRTGGWAHDASSLRPDPSVRFGTLPNGFRYALLPHTGVPGRISLQLIVLVGSLDEQDHEVGLAHFIEHMAFNGTRRFGAGEVIRFFQNLGMAYGSDVNAFTSPETTVYKLELPRNDPGVVRDSLMLFRDFADGITFDTGQIEKERGVIMSELRVYDGFQFRMSEAANRFFLPGMLLPERIPIGTPEFILGVQRPAFLNFYRKWYRTDLMILVAAGDFTVHELEQEVRNQFGDMATPSTPVPPRSTGRLERSRGLRASIFDISHIGSSSIQVASVAQNRPQPDSIDYRREILERELAMELFSDRMDSMIVDAGGGMAYYERFRDLSLGMARLSVSGDNWRHGVASLDQLIRYTRERGFTDREVSWKQRRRLLEMGKRKAQHANLDPAVLSESLMEAITAGRVFQGFVQDLEMEARLIRAASPRSLRNAFRDTMDLERLAYHVGGDVSIEGGASAILSAVRQSRRGGFGNLAPVERMEIDFEPKPWGPPGRVVHQSPLPHFDGSLYRFSNNVRLNFMESQREPRMVRARVRVGNGLFETPNIRPGLREFALQTVIGSGTAHYRPEMIQAIVETHLLEFSFDVQDHDAFTFRGTFGNDQLDTFLGLVTEFLFQPAMHRAVHNVARVGAFMGRASGSMGLRDGFRQFQDHLFGSDGRFAWGSPLDYQALGVADARAWLGEALASGYIEVSLIGDIPEDVAVQAVARTLGSLSPRAPEKRITHPPRPVELAARPGFTRLEFTGEEHQAIATGLWPVLRPITLRERAGFQLLSRVLEERIRNLVRERLGVSYAPSADFTPHPEYPAFAVITASIDCPPEEAEQVARAIQRIAMEIGQEGITKDEFNAAFAPFANQIRRARNSNSFLMDWVLLRAQERPESVTEAAKLGDDLLMQLEYELLNDLAREVFAVRNGRVAAIVPRPFVGIFQTGDGSAPSQNVIGRP